MEVSRNAPRALVADDDEFFRLALASILTRQLGFGEVIETSGLDEAVASLGSEQDFSLALFDLEMPGMEGAASLAAVRECHPDLRLAVVTASLERTDVLRALEAGVHGYISKRDGAGALCAALGRVLAGQIVVPDWLAMPATAGSSSLPSSCEPLQPPPRADRLAALLTPRQIDVLRLVTEGKSNKEIARSLLLAEGTVKIHVTALLRTFNVATRAGVAAIAARLPES